MRCLGVWMAVVVKIDLYFTICHSQRLKDNWQWKHITFTTMNISLSDWGWIRSDIARLWQSLPDWPRPCWPWHAEGCADRSGVSGPWPFLWYFTLCKAWYHHGWYIGTLLVLTSSNELWHSPKRPAAHECIAIQAKVQGLGTNHSVLKKVKVTKVSLKTQVWYTRTLFNILTKPRLVAFIGCHQTSIVGNILWQCSLAINIPATEYLLIVLLNEAPVHHQFVQVMQFN